MIQEKNINHYLGTHARTHTEEHAHNIRIIVESIFKPFKVATSKRQKFLFRFKPTNCSSNVADRRNLLSYVKMKSKVDQAPSSHLIKMCLCACPFLKNPFCTRIWNFSKIETQWDVPTCRSVVLWWRSTWVRRQVADK